MNQVNIFRFRKGFILVIHLLWLFIMWVNFYITTNSSNLLFHEIDKWLLISFVALLWYISSYFLLSLKLFTPYSLFVVFSFLFHFGQVLVWRIGLVEDPYLFLMVSNYSPDQILRAFLFSSGSLAMLHTGAILSLLCLRSKNNNVSKVEINNDEANFRAIRITGYVLFMISIFPLIIYDGTYFKTAIQSGYLAIYTLDINYGVWDDLSRLIKPAIIFLMIGYRNNERVSKYIFMFAILYSLLKMFLIGQRGYEMVFLISLVWIRHVGIKRIQGSKAILYTSCGFVLLVFMRIIAETRGLSKGSGTDILSLIKHSLQENPIVTTISEFGSTLTTPIVTMNHIPYDLPYTYGLTYIKSVFTIFPNIGGALERVLYGATPAVTLGDFAQALGGSFIAEFYYNFGWNGMCLAIFCGYIISRFSMFSSSSQNPIVLINSAIFLSILLWFIRDSFSYIPRATVLYIFFPTVVWKLSLSFLHKGYYNKKHMKEGKEFATGNNSNAGI